MVISTNQTTPNSTYPDIPAMNYDQAIEEIEKILQQLEKEQLPIDTILSQSKRVVALIEHCRAKMRIVGNEVDEILQKLRDQQ